MGRVNQWTLKHSIKIAHRSRPPGIDTSPLTSSQLTAACMNGRNGAFLTIARIKKSATHPGPPATNRRWGASVIRVSRKLRSEVYTKTRDTHALYPATRNSFFFALFVFFRGYSFPDFMAIPQSRDEEHKREILEWSRCEPFSRSLRLLRLFAAIPIHYSPISSRNCSSSSTVTPSCVASSSFDPAPGPATT